MSCWSMTLTSNKTNNKEGNQACVCFDLIIHTLMNQSKCQSILIYRQIDPDLYLIRLNFRNLYFSEHIS